MWVFTRDGFFSAVVHEDDPSMLMVRAREGDDLRRAFPGHEVVELELADYRFRATVDRPTFITYLTVQVEELDYETDVKGNIGRDEEDRVRFLNDVWSAGFWFQDDRETGDDDDDDEIRGVPA